jgi:hypothetical protein
MASFFVPDDLRAFMRSVVGYLDAPRGDKFLDAEDALQHECGYGGRIDGVERYRFHYLTPDGAHRWTIILGEHEIRAIADGLQIEVEGERSELARTPRRERTGEPLLVWGAYNDDALIVGGLDDLMIALELLRQSAVDKPRVLRLWSPSDDQLVAALWRDECALYVLESADGYATSRGDPQHTGAFEVLDHDGVALFVRHADCVPWPIASRALIRFAAHGELGPDLPVEGTIPSQLLVHGELDRADALAARAEPAREPLRSSLARLIVPPPLATPDPAGAGAVNPASVTTAGPSLSATERAAAFADAAVTDPVAIPLPILAESTTPVRREGVVELAARARRLIQTLFAQGLIELGPSPGLDEISYQVSGLLQAHGDEAEHSLDTAEWLANEIKAIRGVVQLFATGGDLQLALRRSRVVG